MSPRTRLFGRPLRSADEAAETIGPLAGISVFGLDALASAAYGPEAALTVLPCCAKCCSTAACRMLS